MRSRRRDPGRLATIIWLAAMALGLASVAMIVGTWWVAVPDSWGFRGASVLAGMTFTSVGAIVARRQPGNTIGWLFCAIGLAFAIEGFVNEYVIVGALAAPGRLPSVQQIGWILTWIWVIPAGLALIYLPLLFPSGKLLSPRWRPVAWFGAATMALAAAIISVAPGPIEQATYLENPLGVRGFSTQGFIETFVAIVFAGLGLAVLLALASMVIRFVTSTGEARLQVKWFVFAVAIAGLIDVFYYIGFVLGAPPAVVKASEILLILGLLALPITAGLAVLRYRLYEIDLIISRTIAYAVVSGVLIAIFVATILVLQALMAPVTQSNTLAVAASTLVVAALFQPLRRRVQAVVDRRFHRARYDAERTAAAFSDRLRDQVDLPHLTTDLDATVRTAIAPATLSLWLRGGSR